MSTQKDRMKEFLAYKGVLKEDFISAVGVCKNYFANDSTAIRKYVLEKIRETYPDLNVYWLVSGNGSMLVNETAPSSNEDNAADDEDVKKYLFATCRRLCEEKERDRAYFVEQISMKDKIIMSLLPVALAHRQQKERFESDELSAQPGEEVEGLIKKQTVISDSVDSPDGVKQNSPETKAKSAGSSLEDVRTDKADCVLQKENV